MLQTDFAGVPAQLILLPQQARYRLAFAQKFAVGDRVKFMMDVGSVATGSTGIVIGIEKPSKTGMQRSQDQTVVQK